MSERGKLLDRLLRRTPPPPEGAHGQRHVDGSFFSIWKCQRGHFYVGEVDSPPDTSCFECVVGTHRDEPEWTRATREEAHAFALGIDGDAIRRGIGATLL